MFYKISQNLILAQGCNLGDNNFWHVRWDSLDYFNLIFSKELWFLVWKSVFIAFRGKKEKYLTSLEWLHCYLEDLVTVIKVKSCFFLSILMCLWFIKEFLVFISMHDSMAYHSPFHENHIFQPSYQLYYKVSFF